MTEDDEKNPCSLKNILNAIASSRRVKHWNQSPKEFGPDNPRVGGEIL